MKIDLTGQRFGMLTVTGVCREKSGKNKYWHYVCDCGAVGAAATTKLRSGQMSCGCRARGKPLTHGQTVGGTWTTTYRCYRAMIARCYYPSQVHYQDYGGRGIIVCDRWLHGEGGKSGFDCFLADMGEKPDGLTIDRENNNGNYEPGNCRWVTQAENTRNTRRTKLTHDKVAEIRARYSGGEKSASLASYYGISRTHVRDVVLHAVW